MSSCVLEDKHESRRDFRSAVVALCVAVIAALAVQSRHKERAAEAENPPTEPAAVASPQAAANDKREGATNNRKKR
jgi:hypothetical protein